MNTNITTLRRSEEEKKAIEQRLLHAQKLETIANLAGGIAHDFNNILGGIFGYAQLAKLNLRDNPKAKNYVEQLCIASERAKGLVGQILTFSRQSKSKKKPTDIGLITKEAIKLLRATLPATINIEKDVRTNLGLVRADPNQIHQIVMNIFTNAYHAMRFKGGNITVTLNEFEIGLGDTNYPNTEPGMYIKLIVSDSGHGMDAMTLTRIFEPYFTTKDKGEGTGMGLAVVHGIVKEHDGDIKVHSEPGVGSTFEILLPVMSEGHNNEQVDPEFSLDTGNETILFVDDEEMLVEIGKDMLEKLGYRVITYTNSVEALNDFTKRPDDYDLVVTDMTMPGMTGDRFVCEIKKVRDDIPIILCTGFSEKVTHENLKELGVNSLLLKPIQISNLAESVRNAIDS